MLNKISDYRTSGGKKGIRVIRKIIKIGNSDGVTIPVLTMRGMKLKAGDKIEIYIDRPGGQPKRLELLDQLEKTFGRKV